MSTTVNLPTEKELAAAAVAPRVTKQQVLDAIQAESFTLLPNGRTLVCQLALAGGRFTVEGQSACVDKANFNQEFGEKFSRERAVDEIWPLLGFQLAISLALIDKAGPASGALVSLGSALGTLPATYVGTKVVRAIPMIRAEYLKLRMWDLPENENPTDAGYLVEYVEGGEPNIAGFSGYVSWSPRDVFEKAYSVSGQPKETNFIDRLGIEISDLEGRYKKLRAFLGTEIFLGLNSLEQKDQKEQASCMEDLLHVLKKRYRRATGTV